MFTLTSTSSDDNHRITKLSYIGFAALLGVLYDIFFWEQAKGLGFLLFTLVYLFGFYVISARGRVIRMTGAHAFAIAAVVTAIPTVLYDNMLVQSVVPKIVFVLMILYTILLTLRRGEISGSWGLLNVAALRSPFLFFNSLDAVGRDLFTFRSNNANTLRKALVALLISIPVLLLFAALFAGADPVFSQWSNDFFEKLTGLHFGVNLWRILRSLFIAGFFGTIFYFAFREKHTLVERGGGPARRISAVTAAIVLGLVNILFAVFVFVQFKYLFGDSAVVLAAGKTFAEIARDGFFELVWVLVFASVLLSIFYRSYSHHDHPWLVRALELLLIAQLVVVGASALKRMYLYQDAYGFTVLRLYVEWFIYFVFALLAAGVFAILRNLKFRVLVHVGMVGGLLALIIISFINVDRMIAKENIDRYFLKHDRLDTQYLSELSADAAPELVRLNPAFSDPNFCQQGDTDTTLQYRIQENLVAAKKRSVSWREFNVSIMQELVLRTDLLTFSDRIQECRTGVSFATKLKAARESHAPSCADSGSANYCQIAPRGSEPLSYYTSSLAAVSPAEKSYVAVLSRDAAHMRWYVDTGIVLPQGGVQKIDEQQLIYNIPFDEVYILKGGTLIGFNITAQKFQEYAINYIAGKEMLTVVPSELDAMQFPG